jgi:hypothetical protein
LLEQSLGLGGGQVPGLDQMFGHGFSRDRLGRTGQTPTDPFEHFPRDPIFLRHQIEKLFCG